jgi:hypothetical protein
MQDNLPHLELPEFAGPGLSDIDKLLAFAASQPQRSDRRVLCRHVTDCWPEPRRPPELAWPLDRLAHRVPPQAHAHTN